MADSIVATNRKARRDFAILEIFEAGIELKGAEVKSLRQKKANINDSFARIDNGEVYIFNFHVSPYEFGNINNPDPMRPKKLLLHKKEILKLYQETRAKGSTIVPLRVYFKKGYAKVEIAIGRGKKLFDKRESIKEKQAQRDIDRAVKTRKQR